MLPAHRDAFLLVVSDCFLGAYSKYLVAAVAKRFKKRVWTTGSPGLSHRAGRKHVAHQFLRKKMGDGLSLECVMGEAEADIYS